MRQSARAASESARPLTTAAFFFPIHRVTVNLAPADVKKEGSSFDLPIAIGILGANGDLKCEELNDTLIVGELSLDGRVRPVKGALPIAVSARSCGVKRLLLPEENAQEAAVVTGLDVYLVATLRKVVELINDQTAIAPLKVDTEVLLANLSGYAEDFREVRGQAHAKRAIEVATAGAHNIILIGPPGSGKTMLAKRMPTILPPLEFEESLECTNIH